VQLVISDGLNARSLMDDGHLPPFLEELQKQFTQMGISMNKKPIVIKRGRVRAGYKVGETLFGTGGNGKHSILHIIGERPGTMHRNYSVYITTATANTWDETGKVDHDITRVVSGISDTAYSPIDAAREVAKLVAGLRND
jgi:ethanolamine ammonia-lyase large subunit